MVSRSQRYRNDATHSFHDVAENQAVGKMALFRNISTSSVTVQSAETLFAEKKELLTRALLAFDVCVPTQTFASVLSHLI